MTQDWPYSKVTGKPLVCTCLRMDVHERLALWSERTRRTLKRWMDRGKRVDPARVHDTAALVWAIEAGPGAARGFGPADYSRSHHLRGCPCHPRNNPPATIDW